MLLLCLNFYVILFADVKMLLLTFAHCKVVKPKKKKLFSIYSLLLDFENNKAILFFFFLSSGTFLKGS